MRGLTKFAVLPLVAAVIGIAAAAGVTMLLPTTYQATSSVFVGPDDRSASSVRSTDVTLAVSLVTSVAKIAESRQVSVAVSEALGVPADGVTVRLTGRSQPGSQIVQIDASAGSALAAVAAADAAARAVSELSDSLKLGGSAVAVRPLDRADLPAAPKSPIPALNAALGGLLGLLIGIAALVARRRVLDRFDSASQIEGLLGLPVVGVVHARATRRSILKAERRSTSGSAPVSVQGAVAALSVFAGVAAGRRIVVTSVGSREAGRLAAILLAAEIRRVQGDVLLLDTTESAAPAALIESGESAFPELDPGSRSIRSDGDPAPATESGVDVIVLADSVLYGHGLASVAPGADVVVLVVDGDRTSQPEAVRAGMLIERLDIRSIAVLVVARTIAPDGGERQVWAPRGRHATTSVPAARPRSPAALPTSLPTARPERNSTSD